MRQSLKKKPLKKKLKNSLLVLLYLTMLVSCNLFEKEDLAIQKFSVNGDTEPPVLQEVLSIDSRQVRLVFNEPVIPYVDSFEPHSVEVEEYSVLVTLNQDVVPGHKFLLECRVKDASGNSTEIQTPVWGYNANLAKLVINEFSTRGEGNNPDRTELLVQEAGSLAGMVLYNGVPNSWDSCVIFEECSVKQGDYVVVWWTESLPDGVKNGDHDINICACSEVNLPGYNGVLTLAESPAQGSDVIDCVVYSNFSSTFEGFGTKLTMERVHTAQKNGWFSSDKKPVDSTYTTATRTMCRRNDGTWYVCETKGATFGKENSTGEFTI